LSIKTTFVVGLPTLGKIIIGFHYKNLVLNVCN
jgi:hypothetical protein